MSRPIADYVALALVGKVDDNREEDIFASRLRKDFQGSWSELKTEAEDRCGFAITEDVLREAVRGLAQCGLIRVSEDQFAGEFVKIYPGRFSQFVEKARKEDSKAFDEQDELGPIQRPSDYPNASALLRHPVFEDYSELGDEWLRRALAGLRAQIGEAGSLVEFSTSTVEQNAPAADRVVRFTHNQITEFEAQTTEIITGVEALNSMGDKPGLRELIVGQLKAGRELIRSGCFKAYLLEITLIETLQFLAKRYEHDAIGALASVLALALAKHLGLEI